MSIGRCGVCLALFCLTWLSPLGGPSVVFAEEPAASRTRFLILVRGQSEVANFGQLSSAGPTDRFIVLLIGSGVARMTVKDSGDAGDTIRVFGNLQTIFPVDIDESATSPDEVSVPLLVSLLGLLVVDVQYTAVVNPEPHDYLWRLRFR